MTENETPYSLSKPIGNIRAALNKWKGTCGGRNCMNASAASKPHQSFFAGQQSSLAQSTKQVIHSGELESCICPFTPRSTPARISRGIGHFNRNMKLECPLGMAARAIADCFLIKLPATVKMPLIEQTPRDGSRLMRDGRHIYLWWYSR